MKTFKIKTLGCKVNQCDSEAITESMIDSGFKLSNNLTMADIVVINTCAVTQKASMQSRQAIRKAIRDNSNAKLIVTGCYAKTSPEEMDEIKDIDFIITNKCKYKIVDSCISDSMNVQIPNQSREITPHNDIFSSKSHENISYKKTRPFLKIQDGCNSFCTYCIVPYARGRSRSLSENKVLEKIQNLKIKGYKEIVLTGIHIGNYGKDLYSKTNLYRLLCKIINNEYIDRVRISSIEPKELSDDIIQLVRNMYKGKSKICHHFHIPLQSGDDSILKSMHRPYDRKYFIKLVEKVSFFLPDCSIGVDIMVGFPGETETAFNNTYNLIKELQIAYLHIFPFSARKGTPAWDYPDKIDPKVIKERCGKIRKLGIEKQEAFYYRFLGKTLSVLVENERDKKTGKLKGFSENYIPVQFNGPDSMSNTIQQIKINKITKNGYTEGLI